MRRFFVPAAVGAVLIAAALALSACGASSSSASSSGSSAGGATSAGAEGAPLAKGPIEIGMAIAQSGFVAPYDEGPAKGAEMTVDEINAKGGVLGHPLKLIYGDTKSERAQGTSTALELLSQGAQVMIVTCDFDYGSPAAIAATGKNVVAISPCAGSSNFDVPTLGPLAYSLGTTATSDGENGAQFAAEQGWHKAYVWQDSSISYTQELCSSFEKSFGAKPGSSVVGTSTIQQEDTSFQVPIDQLRKSGAEFLELCSYNPGAATALRSLRAAGVDIPVLAGASMDGTYWLEAVPKLSNFYFNTYGLMGGNDPRKSVNEFFAEYKKRFGELPATSYALTGRATIEILAAAIEKAKSTEGPALAQAIDSLGSHETIIGPTGFDESHHIVSVRPTLFIKFEDGKPSPVALYQQGHKVGK
ncbi:MAG: ABC transporter substrate-binding protein [Actinobacteria bacterium]|nr:ABC transporter substrate-binding protein [Actinomycetota bacterium]